MPDTVTIKRKQTGTEQQPQQIRENAKIKLSSVYNGGRPIQGFDLDDELDKIKTVMPKVIDANPDDPKFYDKVSKFWNELSVNIPNEGKTLTIKTYPNGQPVNAREYCIYKFAKKHPLVAKNKDEAKTYRKFKFWIENPEEVKQKKTNKVAIKSQAWTELIQMKESKDKVNQMLRVFTETNPDTFATFDDKYNYLTERMETKPKEFVEMAIDKDLELQDFVLQLLENNVLRKVGNQYMYMDEVIGEGMEQVVAYLKNKRNSSQLSTFKAKLKTAKG